MVRGFKSFKEWFEGYEEQYTIIGGTACDLIMAEEEMEFRATKDIDMVLIVEALTADFASKLWEYIKKAEYEHKNKGTGDAQFYRFNNPKDKSYPTMIELFARKTDIIELEPHSQLTPLPMEDDVSSLSAILLNDEYYNFLKNGQRIIDGIPLLRQEYLIPFKAKAWLDLSNKKKNGEAIDSKNIRKHKNDILRLSVLITKKDKIHLPAEIKNDMQNFINAMRDEPIDMKSIGLNNITKAEFLELIHNCYL
jgi:hypothetical protein